MAKKKKLTSAQKKKRGQIAEAIKRDGAAASKAFAIATAAVQGKKKKAGRRR